jgi:hypothetical protein
MRFVGLFITTLAIVKPYLLETPFWFQIIGGACVGSFVGRVAKIMGIFK